MSAKSVLIIAAPFYAELTQALVDGAMEVLAGAGCVYERVDVTGVLEIPPALKYAAESARGYDGFIALGVVIRGETSHYDIVCRESARGLMELATMKGLALGNGIQMVDNEAQAWARCDKAQANKGAGAARACLRLMDVRDLMAQTHAP